MKTVKFLISIDDETGKYSISPMKPTGIACKELNFSEVQKLLAGLKRDLIPYEQVVNEVCGRYMCEPDGDYTYMDCLTALKRVCENDPYNESCSQSGYSPAYSIEIIPGNDETLPVWESVENISASTLLEMIESDINQITNPIL